MTSFTCLSQLKTSKKSRNNNIMIFFRTITSKSTYKKTFNFVASLAIIVIVMASFPVQAAYAQVMSSGSYKVQSDSLNFAGAHSTSGSYALEDTAGEIATGNSQSANNHVEAGYQQG